MNRLFKYFKYKLFTAAIFLQFIIFILNCAFLGSKKNIPKENEDFCQNICYQILDQKNCQYQCESRKKEILSNCSTNELECFKNIINFDGGKD